MTTPLMNGTRVGALSTAAVPTPKREPKPLGPYGKFLYRQALRILARGGSPADVADYVQHAEGRPIRAVVEAQQDPSVDLAPSLVRGMSQQILQGATLYFGDEALGSLYGMISGQGGQAGRDYYREEVVTFEQQHPGASIAGQLLGGAALSRLVPGLGAGGKLAAAGAGGFVGGVAGLGAAEGDLSERAKTALFGTGVGAVLGAVSVPLAAAAGRAAQAVGRRVAPVAKQVGTTLQPAIERAGRVLQAAMDRLPGSPARVSRQMLRDALARDGLTPAQAAAKVEQRAAHGLPTTVADVGEDHTLALVNLVNLFRGPEQTALTQQLAERGSLTEARLLGAATRNLRLGTQNAYELAEQLQAQRVAQSAPLYQEAFQHTVPVSDRLRRLLQDPRFRQAYEIGRQKANLEDLAAEMTGSARKGLPVPELVPQKGALRPGEVAQRIPGTREISITGARATPPPPTIGAPQPRGFQVAGEAEGLAIPDELPVRALDYTKRGIDDMVNTFTAEGKPVLTRQDGHAMSQLLRIFRDEAGETVPAYKQARAIWEGFSEQLDELENARGFLTKPPEVVVREVAAAKAKGPAALEAYHVRAVQEIADAMHGAAGQQGADRFFGARIFGTQDRSALRRMEALLDDPVMAEDFADKVAGEAVTIATTRRAARPVVPRPQAATRQLTPPGVTQRVLQRTGLRGSQLPTERAQAIANEVTNLFTRGLDNPNDLIALLRNLDGLERIAQRGAAMFRVMAGQQVGRQQEQRANRPPRTVVQ